MPPLKSSLIKPSKSKLFFHILSANFSVTPINSQMYTYLIIVTDATDAVSVNFSGRCKFLQI